MRHTISLRTAALIIVATLVAACGPGAKQKTLDHTLTAVNAARAAFVTWDQTTQEHLVAQAQTFEEGKAALDAHRLRRVDLVSAFEATYFTIALAATDLTDARLADVLATSALLHQVYKDVVGRAPPTKGK